MFAQQYHRVLHEIQMISFHSEEKKERQKERKKGGKVLERGLVTCMAGRAAFSSGERL